MEASWASISILHRHIGWVNSAHINDIPFSTFVLSPHILASELQMMVLIQGWTWVYCSTTFSFRSHPNIYAQGYFFHFAQPCKVLINAYDCWSSYYCILYLFAVLALCNYQLSWKCQTAIITWNIWSPLNPTALVKRLYKNHPNISIFCAIHFRWID